LIVAEVATGTKRGKRRASIRSSARQSCRASSKWTRRRRKGSAMFAPSGTAVGVDLIENDEAAAVIREDRLAVGRPHEEVLQHVVRQQDVRRVPAQPLAVLLRRRAVVPGHGDARVARGRQVRPEAGERVTSSMAFCRIGSRKHSVLPEPVPVVTTTGRAVGDRSSSMASAWCW